MSGNSLMLILLIPTIGAIAIALAGRVNQNLREAFTFVTAGLLAITVWPMAIDVAHGGRSSITLATLTDSLNITLHTEPLGALFATLAASLWIINSLYSVGYMRGNNESHQTRFYVFFAISIAAAMGVALAGNLFTLFLFYEILTLATYPLVTHKGDEATIRSARVYLAILMGTSITLFLPAVIWVTSLTGGAFTLGGSLQGKIDAPTAGLLLAMFVFGIGKAAVMPIHRWLPAAMVAPTPVSALLHAVAVVKAGVFSITKIIIYIFGVDWLFSLSTTQWLVWITSFTIIVASLIALRQTNLKRLLAYSTIGQLSYVVMASAILKPMAEIGAALHMVAHAFGKITLFFAAGAIYVASKKIDITQLAGIGRRMPVTMAAFTVGALSMIGVPPTGGFVSKWYILGGAFEADNFLAIFTIIASTALNAAYFLPIIYAAWFLPEDQAPKKPHGEAPWPMVVALALTALLTLGFFFFNGPVIEIERQLVGGLQ
ncbi:MAG: monovalent cation/H+ antiporter subunit D family protein [Aequoribacter sp.]|uniref:monovalent cation/H+ antiporter subunit D family protein n=1 Tax=Aequoribacter sp. TaxID=2847771 RepID=UPI003C4697F0